VDQPISTGFSIGTPTATNEVDIADQFLGFLQNFEQLFGMSEYRIYLTGESYAGKYLPYIGAGMLDRNDTKLFNLSGE
jgi:carboxypeptidase D